MPYRALVVDDEPLNLEVMCTLLDQVGMECTSIEDPLTIYHNLDQLPPFDVIFLDLVMDQLSGYQVLDLLRGVSVTAPIIACSVYLHEIARTREAGFDGFVGKPIQVTRFPEQLERIMSGIAVWELS